MVSEALIGAAISGGAGAAGTGAQLYTNWRNREFEKEQAQIQRDWNELMYNNQNAWNYEMWQKQNEYNTPSAQVERLRAAGLNPLYYGLDGTGNAGALNASQILGYDRATVGNQLNPLSAGIDAAMKVAQVSNIQANTAKQNNENISETVRREQMLASIEKTRQELENLKVQQGLTESQKASIDKTLEWADRMNEAIVAEKESSAALNEAQKKRIEALVEGEKIIQAKTIEDFEKRWNKMAAEVRRMSKETGLLQKDIENYALNHASNGFMGTGLSFQNFIRAIKGAKPRKMSGDESYHDLESEFNID